MSAEKAPKSNDSKNKEPEEALVEAGPQPGPISQWLTNQGLEHNILENDHLGVEIIGVDPINLIKLAKALKNCGFNYLQCQGGYDEGPGQRLVCFYQLVAMEGVAKMEGKKNSSTIEEVRLKVFLSREGDLRVPSLYGLFRGSDWQERETYDMYGINFHGHPHPKRLLMPEDWKGWPLRKDYVQPDFYEMQDAY
tara:strand:+ start:276 stop:857 length:582 start_codon:yes stop_codon:yes gene_type:complete